MSHKTRRFLSDMRRCLVAMVLAWGALFAVASLMPPAPWAELSAGSAPEESDRVALEDSGELLDPAE